MKAKASGRSVEYSYDIMIDRPGVEVSAEQPTVNKAFHTIVLAWVAQQTPNSVTGHIITEGWASP